MKFLVLAALTVGLATPALAQTDATQTTPSPMPQTDATQTTSSTVPTDTTQTAPASSSSSASAAAAADGAYPMCSRGVTDHCREHSTASGARKHSIPRAR